MENLEETSATIIGFLKGLPFPPRVNEIIFDEKNLNNHKELFLPFFHAVSEPFPSIELETKKIAGAAVYLGALGVYGLDPVLDLQISGEKIRPSISSSFCLLQHAQFLLSKIFPPSSKFWKSYFYRWELHFKELELSKVDEETLIQWNKEDYYSLLSHKYALLFTPLDICYHLSHSDHKTYSLLENALKDFIIGYNIPNEIVGFQQDTELNIANYSWCKMVPKLKEIGLQVEDYSLSDLHKLLYLTGTAENMYQESLQAYDRCLITLKELNLGLLEKIVSASKKKIKQESEMSNEYIKSLRSS